MGFSLKPEPLLYLFRYDISGIDHVASTGMRVTAEYDLLTLWQVKYAHLAFFEDWLNL